MRQIPTTSKSRSGFAHARRIVSRPLPGNFPARFYFLESSIELHEVRMFCLGGQVLSCLSNRAARFGPRVAKNPCVWALDGVGGPEFVPVRWRRVRPTRPRRPRSRSDVGLPIRSLSPSLGSGLGRTHGTGALATKVGYVGSKGRSRVGDFSIGIFQEAALCLHVGGRHSTGYNHVGWRLVANVCRPRGGSHPRAVHARFQRILGRNTVFPFPRTDGIAG